MPRQFPPEFRQRALRMLEEAGPEHETENACWIRFCGEHLLGAFHTPHSRGSHDPAGLVPADRPPLPAHQGMHFPHPVDTIVFRMQPDDLDPKELVTERRDTVRDLAS
jgi:hypothetical protein